LNEATLKQRQQQWFIGFKRTHFSKHKTHNSSTLLGKEKEKHTHTPHDGKTFGDNNTMNTNVGVRRKKIQGQANLSMKQGSLFCLSC